MKLDRCYEKILNLKSGTPDVMTTRRNGCIVYCVNWYIFLSLMLSFQLGTTYNPSKGRQICNSHGKRQDSCTYLTRYTKITDKLTGIIL